jgi:hypothetical protein
MGFVPDGVRHSAQLVVKQGLVDPVLLASDVILLNPNISQRG